VELARQPSRIATRSLLLVAGAFGIVTALVVAGRLNSLDQYGIDHWSPALEPGPSRADWRGLVRPFSWDISWWQKLLDAWTYPASVLVSVLIFAAACAVLVRRGRALDAVAWVSAWVAGNAIEVLGKGVLDRPPLYGTTDNGARLPVLGFADSYPSGHSFRSVLVAALVVYVWPRALWPALAWVALVPSLLVVTGAHTVSDVVGGSLLGLVAVLAVYVAIDSVRART
jgi:membrane-associated phospholipid phosphatase